MFPVQTVLHTVFVPGTNYCADSICTVHEPPGMNVYYGAVTWYFGKKIQAAQMSLIAKARFTPFVLLTENFA